MGDDSTPEPVDVFGQAIEGLEVVEIVEEAAERIPEFVLAGTILENFAEYLAEFPECAINLEELRTVALASVPPQHL